MNATPPDTYRLGRIPDFGMWEQDFGFRIDTAPLDAPVDRPECSEARHALDGARQAIRCAQTLTPFDMAAVQPVAAALEAAQRSAAVAANAGRESSASQTGLLADADRELGRALAVAHELRGMYKVYHHSANKRQEEARLRTAVAGILENAQAAAAHLESAVRGLEVDRIGFAVDPTPAGVCRFDGRTGVFAYHRAETDDRPLQLSFGARVGGRPVLQRVTLMPLPATPGDAKGLVDERIGRDLFETQRENRYATIDDTEPDKKQLVLTGLDLKLDDDLFSGSFSRIQVNGHIVRVSGQLKNKAGRLDLRIFARYLVFEPGSSIDVSGRRGKDWPKEDVARGGQTRGENGADGEKGQDGQPGGVIEIVAERILGTARLLADGAPGGRGQGGGKGAQGAQGDTGARDVVEDHYGGRVVMHIVTSEGSAGGPGKTPGKGGRAGQRGDPGQGGRIDIRTVLPCLRTELQARPGQVFLSAADVEAQPGAGGEKGEGGLGGSRYEGENFWGSMRYGCYPPGPLGEPGTPGDPAPAASSAQAGTMGRMQIGYAELCAALVRAGDYAACGTADGTVLAMTLFAAERLYLNAESPQDAAAVREVLDYLLRLTANPPLGPQQAKLLALHGRCVALRDGLLQGLDYFGKTPNFVPLLSLEETQVYYNRALQVARDLESDCDSFWKKLGEGTAMKASLDAQIRRSSNMVDRELEPRRQKLLVDAAQRMSSIDSLTQQAIAHEAAMNLKLQAFEIALREKQSFDMFKGVLQMTWSILMLGVNGKSMFSDGLSTLVAIAGGAVPSGDAGDQAGGEAAGAPGTDKLVESIGKVKGDLDAIYETYKAIGFADRPRSDDLKIVPETLDKASFDNQIDRLLDVDGAEALKETVHAYLDLVAQRNQAVVEHDAAVLQARKLAAQIELLQQEEADLEAQKAIDANPHRAVFVQYMAGSLQLAKSFLVETLYLLARATDFQTLSRTPLRLADYRVATLEKAYGETQGRLLKAQLEVGARTEVLGTCRIQEGDERIQRLRRHEPVWLLLPPNTNQPPHAPFANVERPMVHRVQCHLEGVSGRSRRDYVTVSIEHCGMAAVWNPASAKLWAFVHEPVTTSFQYLLADEDHELGPGGSTSAALSGDLTEGGKFMRLSPFALWGIRLRRDDGMNADIDFSGLRSLEVRFWGTGKVAGVRPESANSPPVAASPEHAP